MDIKGFFKDARRRGLPKGTSRPVDALVEVPAPTSEIDDTEKNLVQAAMGFSFKCGVCRKPHKSSHREKVKGLAVCVGKVLREFGQKNGKRYGNNETHYGFGVLFLPDPETADTMVFTYKRYNAFSAVHPASSAVDILYPILKKRFDTFSERLNDTFSREIIEELSIKEALGAPHTIQYIRARQEAFRKRALAEYAQVEESQKASDPETFALARDWRKLKPEKFKVGKMERGYGYGAGRLYKFFKNALPAVEPIKTVEINRTEQGADTVLSWFNRMGGSMVWNANGAGSSTTVLYDVGSVDGFPAISWGLIGAKDEGGAKRPNYKGSTVLNFISLWNGNMFLNANGWSEEFLLSYFTDNRRRYVSVSPEKDSPVVEQAD